MYSLSYLFTILTVLQTIIRIHGVSAPEYLDGISGGSWEVVVPHRGGAANGKSLNMQSVHAALLPSGSILLASGSSWRNRGPIETHPSVTNPRNGQGVFRMHEDPFHVNNTEDYYQLVNNVAIYDPTENTFYRVPHPVPVPDPKWPNHFVPTDLFCTGHLHVPDGNVLFVGGTQYYYPFRTGHRATFLFDWKKETNMKWNKVDWRRIPPPESANNSYNPWIFAGLMERGRWYATLVPLLDGRLVVIAGFVGFDVGYQPMYSFENNDFVELFDARLFNKSNPQAAWKRINVKSMANGPFTNLINPNFKPTPGVNCSTRCMRENQYDVFKLYEQAYLIGDGRLYLTREGDFVSARTEDTAFMRRTNATYYMYIGGSRQAPTVSFSFGPPRQREISSYGTTVLDPNSGRILLFGGQPTSAGTFLYQKNTRPGDQRFAGGRGSRKLEEFHSSIYEPYGGHWTLKENFLGDHSQDDRTMHYAILLPTSQILIINGANYDFYGSVNYPLLLTPKFDQSTGNFLGYDKQRMNEGIEARLYHSVALLLPDGRIWISGGGSARATIRHTPLSEKPLTAHNSSSDGQPLPDTSNIDLNVEMFDDGRLATNSRGSLQIPTETWVAEIFSPPYLFIDGERRAAIVSFNRTKIENYQFESMIGGKRYYLLRSNTDYLVYLRDLPQQCPSESKDKLVMIKLGSSTHGWDSGQRLINLPFKRAGSTSMLQMTTLDAKIALIAPGYYMIFYVDCLGKPSVAQMIRFDDEATEP